MPALTIDGRRLEAAPGATVLETARAAGIEIPTLCYLEGFEAGASCMVCAVKLVHNGQFIPACGSRVVDGMEIESGSPDVRNARRMALELLFSDHLGDCLSPCQRICPAQLGIPAVLQHLRDNQPGKAAGVIRRDLPLAGILCRTCHRPCESGCRRGVHDESVAIADLVTHAIDTELAAGAPRVPPAPPDPGTPAVVVGAGFSGLATAWFLRQHGVPCVVVEANSDPAATLHERFPGLPAGVLEAEIGLLERAGVSFRSGVAIIDRAALDRLAGEFGAVVLATGPQTAAHAAALGLTTDGARLAADKETMLTSMYGVFAVGRAIRPAGQPVQSAADAKAVAVCVRQHLTGGPVRRPPKPFSIFMGRVEEAEMADFLLESNAAGRVPVADIDHAIEESRRCVKCNCAKADVCKLRQLAVDYGVNPHRFSSGERLRYSRNVEHPLVRFEPAKCIRCGNCIKVAGDHAEALGLTFIGRGFDVHPGVPFHASMQDALRGAAAAAVAACPTGALTVRQDAGRIC